MAVSAAERRYLLNQVDRLAKAELDALWSQAALLSDVDFAQFIIDAFPDLVDPYVQMSADLAATWFELSAPASNYIATTADPIPVERLQKSANWALGASGREGLNRLSGALQRAVFDGSRDTTLLNVDTTSSRWARHARQDACQFCKMLATRHTDGDNLFTSEKSALVVVGRGKDMTLADRRARARGEDRREGGRFSAKGRKTRGSRKFGEKYHDDCHCVAIEVREGQTYTPPDYVAQWSDDYLKARAEAGTGDPKKILAAWRQIDASKS